MAWLMGGGGTHPEGWLKRFVKVVLLRRRLDRADRHAPKEMRPKHRG